MKRIIVLLFGLAVVTGGCDKNFGDININRNAPQEVSPALILPGILRSIFQFEVTQSFNYGNTAVNQVVKSFADWSGRYNWTTNGAWGHCYGNLRNVAAMTDAAAREGKPLYEGVALILRSYLVGLNTQIHGDVPYSEAIGGKTEGNFTPVYDEQERVFEGIIDDLERANDILSAGGTITGDIVYDGDPLLWRKFANTYRLRILTRLSEKWDVGPMIRQIVDNSERYPLIQSNEEAFALTFLSSAPNQYPMHTYRLGDITDQRLCKSLADTLLDYHDARIAAYATPTANSIIANDPVYVGVPNGLYNAAINNYNGGEANQSHISDRYHSNPAATHTIMSYAELQFILAEAAAKGWISGDARTYYEAGIIAAHAALETPMSPGYLSQPSVELSADPSVAIRQIIVQKWIASFYYGMEAYFEYRRTGFPNIVPGPDNVNDDQVPMRFRYPTQEQDLNGENYKAAIARQGEDDINTLMWLLK
ncbi:SusD/RagB family nutrient-binding outer membrane lipoprotein [Parapedobacter sp.]